MSGRGPTLKELLETNPAARELLDKHCDAQHTAAGVPFRCGLPRNHHGSHYDMLLQIAWESRPIEPVSSEPSGDVQPSKVPAK